MGFMDKAKKLAEQAQTRLEEAQTQLNASQAASAPPAPGAPPVQYDQHGRPIAEEPAPSPGRPSPAAPSPGAPPVPETPDRPHGDPLAPEVPTDPSPAPSPSPSPSPGAALGDRNVIDYTPPRVTSGDPLSG